VLQAVSDDSKHKGFAKVDPFPRYFSGVLT